MKLYTIKNFFRDSFHNIRRNSLMSVASVLSVVCALVIVGVVLVLAININYMTTQVEQNLEVKVYMEDEITATQRDAIYETIKASPYVSTITYESKEDALNNFKDILADKAYILSGYEESGKNPLHASYVVKVNNSANIEDVYLLSKDLEGVNEVVYGEDILDNFRKLNALISLVSISIFIILSIVALFIIYNTIKLTVFARRNDISIMKYIGATDNYIRFPFIIEGSILGVLGSIVALLIIRNVYYFFMGYVQSSLTALPLGYTFAPAGTVMLQVCFYFVIYGILIGALGSSFSIRKYLNV